MSSVRQICRLLSRQLGTQPFVPRPKKQIMYVCMISTHGHTFRYFYISHEIDNSPEPK